MARHNNVKIYNAIFLKKTVCLICRHSSLRTMTLLSRNYTARRGTTMNYAKTVVIFVAMHIFS